LELSEAAHRILRNHLGVILVLVLAGLAAPVALHAVRDDPYVATTRVVIADTETRNAEASSALVDTAVGIVTSPARVQDALKQADVARDPVDVAEHHVAVQPIGTSGVLEVSVSDTDRAAAASIANALADVLVALRTEVVIGDQTRLLAEVNQQIEKATERIDEVTRAVAAAQDGPIAALRLQHDEALRARSDLESQRQRLVETIAKTPKPTVVDTATPPDSPASSGLMAQLVVGGLLGLLLGLVVAAVIEALRPTIVGPEALARTLGAPLLGQLPRSPAHDETLRDRWLPHNLRVAASGAGVQAARLVALGPPIDLTRLARWLREGTSPSPAEAVDPRVAGYIPAPSQNGSADPFPNAELTALEAPAQQIGASPTHESSRSSTGIVVVAPDVLRRDDLDALEHRLSVTGWPLIGVVTYRHRWFEKPAKPPWGPGSAPAAAQESSPSTVPAS
jgi:capsular polysaccharide biosynthesis protein